MAHVIKNVSDFFIGNVCTTRANLCRASMTLRRNGWEALSSEEEKPEYFGNFCQLTVIYIIFSVIQQKILFFLFHFSISHFSLRILCILTNMPTRFPSVGILYNRYRENKPCVFWGFSSESSGTGRILPKMIFFLSDKA